MIDLIAKIKETVTVISEKTKEDYPVGIILGTGLGGLSKRNFSYS
jgi:purine-nucleoside phosphorylase